MKIRKFAALFLIMILVPSQVMGATYWTGNNYFNENEGESWNVTENRIVKVKSPGRAYEVSDISTYSAHMTNNPRNVGDSIEDAFFWINESRLAYVKLFKVNGGSSVSFLFDKSIYLYCAEFDSSFTLIEDGEWGTNGTHYTLNDKTEWIMVVFRKVNGDLENGSGLDTVIKSSDFDGFSQKYIIFEPFIYTLKMNGGTYMNSTDNVTMERLGVESITLPTPKRTGYKFTGWKTSEGNIYKGTLSNTYSEDLFKDATLKAVWSEIMPASLTLNKEYIILEQNSGKSFKLTANVLPSNANNKTVTYTSSNSKIARVDANGNITPLKTGTATIKAETVNGLTAECTVYVMGFNVSVPTCCILNETYEIKVNIYNNGTEGMTGRKRVILDSEDTVDIIRVGDSKTVYTAQAETKGENDKSFSGKNGGYFADTYDSEKIYYRLRPKQNITKAGDYEGNVTFTVSVL